MKELPKSTKVVVIGGGVAEHLALIIWQNLDGKMLFYLKEICLLQELLGMQQVF